ncbi:ABC transporter ATP-binding protein [Nitriliruptor alkaliphilus]|uniref:ABC transporter ATP-binding protein n=1 Tax=Nitriliruptor alkaliphilus TaxID=427918 RepID=UPI000AE814AF|nr:ABC transporter ATP-binding protein [Nitriliruptor alkaliphilus]
MSTAPPAAGPPVLLEARDVVRTYRLGSRRGEEPVLVPALRGVTFHVDRGDYVAIVGSSGSGKSTLLNLLGALDRPTSGEVRYDGRDVREMSDTELAELRNGSIGFVFQSFHLLPRLTALDNVQLPLVYRPSTVRERRERALAALEAVGLADRVDHRPTELSGGQQQRVAIARALVTEPPLLLADEPTGNLDTRTGHEVMGLLETLHDDRGVAVVVITHEPEIARRARRRIELRDGRILTDSHPEGPVEPAGAP